MPSEQDSTAVVAIVIALIAFFVTTAQLLQALFGTAVGYRQCQPSVMGEWALKTRRRWRWSEFRFETIFTTPNIQLDALSDEQEGRVYITGGEESRRETYCFGGTRLPSSLATRYDGSSETADDLVGWLSLLNILHVLQESFFKESINGHLQQTRSSKRPMVAGNMTCPAITFRTRSWDFMPPDIVRPFATSCVGDVIALAHRLGMRWKEIRPDDGVIRAEGNGQSITSTTVRGFGLLLQYTFDRSIVEDSKHVSNRASTLTIPSCEADMLGFQIVPGCKALDLPDFVFDASAGFSSIRQAMIQLGVKPEVRKMYAAYYERSGRLDGFSDLVGMVAPFLPLPGSSVVQIFNLYTQFQVSPTNWWEGFAVYYVRLLQYTEEQTKAGDDSEQMRWVLDRFEYMKRTYPNNKCPSWDDEIANKKIKNGGSLVYLDDLRNIWLATMDYFRKLQSQKSLRYIDLVGAHIAQAVYYPDQTNENIKDRSNKRFQLGVFRSEGMAEGMHIYVDQIPKVVDFMKEKGFGDAKIVTEAWWTLMLRAMCWHRSIAWVEIPKSNFVSPSFHGSRIPVYIA